jgi:hypothetical protein
MDLDELIRDADPARDLTIDVPEPDRRVTSGRHRQRRRSAAPVLAAVVAVVLVVGAVFLGVRHQRPSRPASVANALPLGASLRQAGPTGVLAGTRRLLQVYPDPGGGPAWGFATYQTQSGMTCLQVGRSQSGLVGAIGEGAFGNDGRFHPFTFSDLGLGTCAPDDARGHAFLNLGDQRFPANAAQEPCTVPPARVLARLPAGIRKRVDRTCPNRPVRDVYFGLLGPEATSITYVANDGRLRTESTAGPDGGYLIVRTAVSGSCDFRKVRAKAPAACLDSGGGIQSGATLFPGEIVAVRYRDGHVCRLPVPQGNIVELGSQCRPIGYTAPAGLSYTASQLAAPVTIRKLPARRYCLQPGPYRPAAPPIPCDASIPSGYRLFPSQRQLLVYITWTARAPVKNTQESAYSFTLQRPRACGGMEGNSTQAIIRAGEGVTRPFFVSESCRGTYTGVVSYIPNLGPDGTSNLRLGITSPGNGTLLVGRFSFTVP